MRDWRAAVRAEHLFLVAGFAMILSSVAADLVLRWTRGNPGGHGDVQFMLLLNFSPMGIAFIAWGFCVPRSRVFLDGWRGLSLLLAFLVLLFDGVVHLFAFNAHLERSALHAAFFLFVGALQVAGAFTLPKASRTVLLGWVLLTILLLALYAVSRATTLLGDLEEIEGMGLVAKGSEVLLLGALVYRARNLPSPSPQGVARTEGSARTADAKSPDGR